LGFRITPSFDAAVGPPFIQVSGLASVGNPIPARAIHGQSSFEFNDSLSWIRGRHQWKLGASIDAIKLIAHKALPERVSLSSSVSDE